MKLHQSAAVPDWEQIAPSRWNIWQRWAAASRGVLTLGNVLSLAGLLLAGLGLWYIARGWLWHGLICIGAGRLFDIADGAAAERTGTKSPLGETVDASFDKLIAFAALIVLVAARVLPWPLGLLIGLHNAIVAIVALAARLRKKRVHPELSGKIAAALQWLALPAFIIRKAAGNPHAAFAAGTLGYILSLAALALGTYALIRYLKRAVS